MNILINGKEFFLNVNNVSTIEKKDDGMVEIKMNNKDKVILEPFSFIYFRDNSSSNYAPFIKEKYLIISKGVDNLSKNKFIPAP